jgi:RHS repeat-associated protein
VVRDEGGVDAGCVVATTSHLPYGGIEAESGAELCAGAEGEEWYRFTGKELEGEFGIYYFGARYYNPALGRWLSVDKYDARLDRVQYERYIYSRNNPFTYVDPDGNMPLALKATLGLILKGIEKVKRIPSALKAIADDLHQKSLQQLEGKPPAESRISKLVRQELKNRGVRTESPMEEWKRRQGEAGEAAVAIMGLLYSGRGLSPRAPQCYKVVLGSGPVISDTARGVVRALKPEARYLRGGKHGVQWKEGPSLAKTKGPQGQWGSKADLDYAGTKAATLKPGEHGTFPLPEGHSSVVHLPSGTTVPAKNIWVRNNGTGTFHGYPTQ